MRLDVDPRPRVQNVEVDPLGIVQAVGTEIEIAGHFDGDAGDVVERPVTDRGHRMQRGAIALRKQHRDRNCERGEGLHSIGYLETYRTVPSAWTISTT